MRRQAGLDPARLRDAIVSQEGDDWRARCGDSDVARRSGKQSRLRPDEAHIKSRSCERLARIAIAGVDDDNLRRRLLANNGGDGCCQSGANAIGHHHDGNR